MEDRVWLNWAMHLGFFLLLGASAARLVARHGFTGWTDGSLLLCLALALIYATGVAFWDRLGRGRRVWLAALLACWLVLVVVAPSFSWCAIPLFFVCLRLLPPRVTVAVAAVLTAAVIVAQVRIADVVEPSLVLAPIGFAAMTTVIFWELRRVIDDLVRTRGTLAESQRRTGVLEERERLAREIHDTLAQGLTSVGLLLQAADRAWPAETAREHVRRAATATAENLEEARRFVRDLRPRGLESSSLPEALAELCHEDARFRCEGEEFPLPPEVEDALLRVAQGALANARDHAAASQVIVTLAYLEGEVTLDVFDDGVGFDEARPAPGRGYGLRAMRDRLAGVGGTLVVESAPGEGTAVAARIRT